MPYGFDDVPDLEIVKHALRINLERSCRLAYREFLDMKDDASVVAGA